jgi:hypothetical protein
MVASQASKQPKACSGRAIARDEMDDETFGEIARRYGMEVICPVPEGYV